jgi:membrane-bound lytic murein transglycosylase A
LTRKIGERPTRWLTVGGLAATVLLLVGLAQDAGPPRLILTPVDFTSLTGWAEDRVAAAVPAFLRSCARFLTRPDAAPFDAPAGRVEFGRIGDWRPLCRQGQTLEPDSDLAARRFFEAGFVPMAVADYGEVDGLFTGYFEIELNGSRKRDGRFRTPIFRRPPTPALEKRYSRAEIEEGALSGRGLVLVWVDDPIGAFFLHIQGSGRVRLPNGMAIRLGYDGQNGRPYVPVGRLLVERGEIAPDRLTMAAIRDWMARHPAAGERLRREDPSYVFFRELKNDGPLGAEQVVLTPRRSLAIDPSFIPFGAPIWLDAEERYRPDRGWHRLMVAQDAGGAIKGPVRGDFFWGTGATAGKEAGEMDALGRYFVLLPRTTVDRRDARATAP